MTNAKQILSVFGINAIIGKEKGLTVQEIANVNKDAPILLFGLTELVAEKAVTMWVDSCVELKVMA